MNGAYERGKTLKIRFQFIDEWASGYAKVIINPVRDGFICLVEVTRTLETVSVARFL